MSIAEATGHCPVQPGRPKVSDTPTVRFITSIRTDDASAAVNNVLEGTELKGLAAETRSLVFEHIAAGVRRESAGRYIPTWLNQKGLCNVITEIPSMAVWKPLLEQAPVEIQEAVLRDREVHTVDAAASRFEELNTKFITRAITHVFLGAVVGSNISEVLSRTTPFTRNGKVILGITIAYDVALEIGKRFGTTASSPQELLDRVQRLIPDPDAESTQSDIKLMSLFVKYHTFDNPDPSKPVRCPAVRLSRTFLDVWGRHLANDEAYQQRFLAAVQK